MVVLEVEADLVVEVGFVDVLSVLLVVPADKVVLVVLTEEIILVVLLVVLLVAFDVMLLPLPPATAPEA